jgi:hypothetical protein
MKKDENLLQVIGIVKKILNLRYLGKVKQS